MNTSGPIVTSAKSKTLVDRFMRKGWTVTEGGCWEWNGSRMGDGYGQIYGGPGNPVRCHRLAYELFVGDIPVGGSILHSCDNPPCVNPDHLRVGIQAENMADAAGRRRFPSGEASPHAKLTLALVEEIRASSESNKALALRMGVSPAAVWQVRTGRSWVSAGKQDQKETTWASPAS